MPGSCKWPLSITFPHQTLYAFLFPIHATYTAYLILLDLITQIIFGNIVLSEKHKL